jgi:hypothetical protein
LGHRKLFVFRETGQLVIAADTVAVPVAALALAAVGAPCIVVVHLATERQPVADTPDFGTGLGTEGLEIRIADMQVYMHCSEDLKMSSWSAAEL